MSANLEGGISSFKYHWSANSQEPSRCSNFQGKRRKHVANANTRHLCPQPYLKKCGFPGDLTFNRDIKASMLRGAIGTENNFLKWKKKMMPQSADCLLIGSCGNKVTFYLQLGWWSTGDVWDRFRRKKLDRSLG
jgi:hypothetical protein